MYICHVHPPAHSYTGGIVPFSNPTGILIFTEDSVQTINLTLINNNTLEVCINVMNMSICIVMYCLNMY